MAITSVKQLFENALADARLSKKQKEVLKVSLVLFSEKGFENTTTHDIAEKAGVAEGTVYKKFKTKEGILIAILTPLTQSVIPSAATEFIAMLSNTNYPLLGDFLFCLVQNRVQFANENRLQLKIFVQELFHNPQLVDSLKQEISSKLTKELEHTLYYYQQQGQLIAWPATRIIRYLISTVLGYLVPSILLGQELDVENVSHEAVEFLLKGLGTQE